MSGRHTIQDVELIFGMNGGSKKAQRLCNFLIQLSHRAIWQTRQAAEKNEAVKPCIEYFKKWVHLCLRRARKSLTDYQFFEWFGGENGLVEGQPGEPTSFVL